MKNKLHYLLSVLLLFSYAINAQTNCVEGFAGQYPCNNMDLLSHIPLSVLASSNGFREGSDAWGWTDPLDGKEYAIVATSNSTAFVDISDPVNPIFLGRLDTSAGVNSWRDVKVYNNHAFIVADNVGPHGMQVFDLRQLRNVNNPPQTLTANVLYSGVESCHNIVINESIGMAYLVGCNTYGGGPVFVDISDPENPVSAGGYAGDGYTHDAQVITYNGPDSDYTGREIFIGSNEDKVVILDVTDKDNVVKINDISYSQLGYTHQGWFTEDQRYFILGDEVDELNYGVNTRTIIFDFLDLDNPVVAFNYFGTTEAIDHNGYVLGDEYYLANYRAGIRILDITNIGSSTGTITETAYFDTYPNNDNASFSGAWSVYPYFESGSILISDIQRGMFVVRKSQNLSVGEEQFNTSFTLSPNPTNEPPLIKASQNQLINTVDVYNNLGQKLYSKTNIGSPTFTLPILNYNAGIYFVRINNTAAKKLVIK